MSVVTFWGNDKIETAQTTSMAGIATYLSIEQNYRILLINAKYNDTSLADCFWEYTKNSKIRTDLETGIGGLMKAISSNKASPEIITNYTRAVFKDRLEILTDYYIPKEDFDKQRLAMKTIITMANKFYDLVFVDIEGSVEDPIIQDILNESNLIVANTTQREKYIDEFKQLFRKSPSLKKDKIIYLFGKYDKFSRYNIKNIQRNKKIGEAYGIPYNTLFFESCNNGRLTDYIYNFRRVKPNNIHASIMSAFSEVSTRIVEKLKELQMQI